MAVHKSFEVFSPTFSSTLKIRLHNGGILGAGGGYRSRYFLLWFFNIFANSDIFIWSFIRNMASAILI